MKFGVVDTEKYRYKVVDVLGGYVIKRIEKCYLETTKAIDGWEVVKVVK